MNYLEYKKLRAENQIALGIENDLAMKYVRWLPQSNRIAIYFWSWIAISMIPAGLLLGYLYSWWWLLLIPLHRTVWSANKKSASEFLIESAEKDGGLFALVQNNSDWVFSKNHQPSSGDPVLVADVDANHKRPSNTLSTSDLDVIDESPRELRRLYFLREWSHEQDEQIFPGSQRACRTAGTGSA